MRGLFAVPAGDGPADHAGDLPGEVLGHVAGCCLDGVLDLGGDQLVAAQALAHGGHGLVQADPQLRARVSGLGAELGLGVPPQRRRPSAQLGLGDEVGLELLPPLPQRGRGLQVDGQLGQPRLDLAAQLMVGVAHHVGERPAGTVDEPIEEPLLDRTRKPPP
jgi:hypothetical protein